MVAKNVFFVEFHVESVVDILTVVVVDVGVIVIGEIRGAGSVHGVAVLNVVVFLGEGCSL